MTLNKINIKSASKQIWPLSDSALISIYTNKHPAPQTKPSLQHDLSQLQQQLHAQASKNLCINSI